MDSLGVWLAGMPAWMAVGTLVGGSFLAAVVVNEVGLQAVRFLTRRTRTDLDDRLLRELRVPVPVTVAVAGAYVAPSVVALDAGVGLSLQAAAFTVAVLVWARTVARAGGALLVLYDERTESNADFAPIFANLWQFAVILAAILLVLWAWQVEITPFLASAGIAGIAIGFAAKDTVANFFGSIALYVDNTYKVGDYVVLDTGVAGTVLDISIRSTRLLTRDNVVVTVPNSVLNSAQIINNSAPVTKTRIKVPVGVAYGSDLDVVEACLLDAAAAEDHVARSPEPRVRLRGFGDSGLDYELLAWVRHPLHDAKATHALNRAIHDRFVDAAVEIPFPQRDLHVRTSDLAGGIDAADVSADAAEGRDSRMA
ncbi:mechanosensitive ion channel family protein [Halocalculus aciditolerans]|uniref:Mechanosensitive ion channel n=1 Tax=Halocalculus aciditolerans TaxID=1383812 RepID=A0A830FAX9_9EURY|nr:mechanosensitive ion channel family protein [Halocalculus aciditolerans]GGL56978.1 hypothetical protein GCM10009039_13910 [Halocalculus aciditolerans]